MTGLHVPQPQRGIAAPRHQSTVLRCCMLVLCTHNNNNNNNKNNNNNNDNNNKNDNEHIHTSIVHLDPQRCTHSSVRDEKRLAWDTNPVIDGLCGWLELDTHMSTTIESVDSEPTIQITQRPSMAVAHGSIWRKDAHSPPYKSHNVHQWEWGTRQGTTARMPTAHHTNHTTSINGSGAHGSVWVPARMLSLLTAASSVTLHKASVLS